MTQLALFLAMGIVLSIVESMIPLPIAIPGLRLGLANTIGLILLYYYSPKEYFAINGLRVIAVGLLRSGLFSISFMLSLSGFLLSSIVAIVIYYLRKFSIFGLSVISSSFHIIGQIFMVIIIYNQWYFIYYLGVLIVISVITGLLTALVSSFVLKKLDKHINFI